MNWDRERGCVVLLVAKTGRITHHIHGPYVLYREDGRKVMQNVISIISPYD